MLNLIAVCVFICVCFAVLAVSERSRRQWADQVRATGGDLTSLTPERSSLIDRWETDARQAGLTWTRLHLFGFAGLGACMALLLILTGSSGSAFLVLMAGMLGPMLWVKRLANLRRSQFASQLPQALFLAASVLRAGGTLLQAVDAIASEMPDPMGEEFKRIQQRMRLHVPAHEAMQETLERTGVREFASVVVAARISSDVGGNLAHVFDQIARSIVEQQNAQRMLRAFTTEGRMSANMIALLPFLVLGLLHFLSPGYLEPMMTTWSGRFVGLTCTGMIVTGWYVIRRMTTFEIF